ncbi:MAG: SUF system Fe-S cluster assembly regulator [Deltaproteobacteria bacterium]|nr:SUF system Fe-S cluster assembly regulator [Deltaproteobacteria bacterium]
MIRITKNADYAIVLLAQIAKCADDALHSARELSEETHIPLPTVSKLLKALAHGELLNSHRGIKGGYHLAREAREISIAEIISAVEGPIEITECVSHEGHCEQEPYCGVSGNWQKINRVIYGALQNMPLTEMIRESSNSFVEILSPSAPAH